MIIKEHLKDGNRAIALCDDRLLGKRFEHDGRFLDLASPFYAGKPADPDTLPEILKSSVSVNAAGEETIAYLKEQGLIEKDAKVDEIDGIPYANVFFM